MIPQTSLSKMNLKVFNKLLKLLQEFDKLQLTASEFLEEKLLEDPESIQDAEIENFILLAGHKEFLQLVKEEFIAHFSLRNYNEGKIILLSFLVIFVLNQEQESQLLELCRSIDCSLKGKILIFFSTEENLAKIALAGCKFFEDDYVLTQIIHPLLGKSDLLKRFEDELLLEKARKYAPKPPTIPGVPTVLRRKKKLPAVPPNTPEEFRNFRARKIPKSLYAGSEVEKKLVGEFEKNRIKALQLLSEAKSLSGSYPKPKPKELEVARKIFKAKKAPEVKNVEIRGNVTAVLREGNLRIKEQEKEIKVIEEILQGGSGLEKYRELEENSRKIEEEKLFESIERKHLEGLLTFEEAILAKKKLIESNKEKFQKFMEERVEFLQKIDEWKEKEEEKIRLLVKKGQDIERRARQSELKLKQDKKDQAIRVKNESREILEEAMKKRKEELAKKVKLIEEIKALHQLKVVKEFDPSNCPNLGLLCEMSIAELQLKLSEVKVKMMEQLQMRRRCIKQRKEKRREMVENVKNFIAQTKICKPKNMPSRPSKLERSTPDLERLRSQLDHVRGMRKKTSFL